MEKKERLKPLSLYGYDLEEAIRAILSVNPKKLKGSKDLSQEARSQTVKKEKSNKS